jgi:hypothetical protein
MHCTVFWVAKIILQRRTETGYAFWVLGESEGKLPLQRETTQTSSGGPVRAAVAQRPPLRCGPPPRRRARQACSGATSPALARGPPPPRPRHPPHLRHLPPPHGIERGRELHRARAPPAGSGRGRLREEEGEGGGPDPAERGREEGRPRPRQALLAPSAAGDALLPPGERRVRERGDLGLIVGEAENGVRQRFHCTLPK